VSLSAPVFAAGGRVGVCLSTPPPPPPPPPRPIPARLSPSPPPTSAHAKYMRIRVYKGLLSRKTTIGPAYSEWSLAQTKLHQVRFLVYKPLIKNRTVCGACENPIFDACESMHTEGSTSQGSADSWPPSADSDSSDEQRDDCSAFDFDELEGG
jgi:hypothetical protein